jgi:hypothetical protein
MVSWLKAVKLGHYQSWPGFDAHSIRRHFPHESIEIQKGHMKKQRQNIRSTKQKVTQNANAADELTHALSCQHLMVKVINETRTIYTNQTGRFPVQSS